MKVFIGAVSSGRFGRAVDVGRFAHSFVFLPVDFGVFGVVEPVPFAGVAGLLGVMCCSVPFAGVTGLCGVGGAEPFAGVGAFGAVRAGLFDLRAVCAGLFDLRAVCLPTGGAVSSDGCSGCFSGVLISLSLFADSNSSLDRAPGASGGTIASSSGAPRLRRCSGVGLRKLPLPRSCLRPGVAVFAGSASFGDGSGVLGVPSLDSFLELLLGHFVLRDE